MNSFKVPFWMHNYEAAAATTTNTEHTKHQTLNPQTEAVTVKRSLHFMLYDGNKHHNPLDTTITTSSSNNTGVVGDITVKLTTVLLSMAVCRNSNVGVTMCVGGWFVG